MGITTREYGPYAKGSRLTTAEMDENFNYLLGLNTTLYAATFFDNTIQNSAGVTAANPVSISSTQANSGFNLGPAGPTGTSVTILNPGIYYFTMSLQLAFTGGASNYNVTVWYTVDDVIVPNSAFTFTTTGAQNDQTLATVTDTIALTGGQNLKFYWWSGAISAIKLLATPAASNPTRPLSPSVNLSIFNVG